MGPLIMLHVSPSLVIGGLGAIVLYSAIALLIVSMNYNDIERTFPQKTNHALMRLFYHEYAVR